MSQSVQPSSPTGIQQIVFSVSVGFIWRAFILRDRILGRIGKFPSGPVPGVQVSRHLIPSGLLPLDAVFVRPGEFPKAAILICHGIGEIVDHWIPAQSLLAANGVASLVFDYTGYGKSRGAVGWRKCEEDAISAFAYLQYLVPETPISLLGFSMGSGIAASILPRVPASRLILCSAFTSFRDAACVLGLPRAFSPVLPRIWCNTELLAGCSVPVLIMHCDRDSVFPVRMASELASHCSLNADLVIVPNHKHNEAFYRPQMSYWSKVIEFCKTSPRSGHEIQGERIYF